MKKHLSEVADRVGAGLLGLGAVNSIAGDTLKAVKIAGQQKQLIVPLTGSMADFERAVFSDRDNFRFVKVILSTNSIAPWSVAADYGAQLAAFIDMVNDVRGVDDFSEYLGSFVDSGKRLIMSWVDSSSPKDLAFTLFLDS